MQEQQTRQKDGQELSRGHDGREEQRPKFLDGDQNEDLTNGNG
jgi:hypothetical protein